LEIWKLIYFIQSNHIDIKEEGDKEVKKFQIKSGVIAFFSSASSFPTNIPVWESKYMHVIWKVYLKLLLDYYYFSIIGFCASLVDNETMRAFTQLFSLPVLSMVEPMLNYALYKWNTNK
jgi:hypothetical protein